MRVVVVIAALTALAALVSCNVNGCLAQFPSNRPQLIADCCACLAHRGTRFRGASCGEAFIGPDGGVEIPPDSGPFIPAAPATATTIKDDLNDTVDDGEIPCLCEGDETSCRNDLVSRKSVVVTGACISQGAPILTEAPCEQACTGVLSFDPLNAGP